METDKLTEQEREFLALRTCYNSKFLAYKPEDEKMVEGIIKKCPELKDRLIKITNKIY